MARRAWAARRKPDEDHERCIRRATNQSMAAVRREGFEPWSKEALREYYRWMGHVARQKDGDTLASIALAWRGTVWWRQTKERQETRDPRNRTGWRHPVQGRIRRQEDLLVDFVGQNWKQRAQDKLAWKKGFDSFYEAHAAHFGIRDKYAKYGQGSRQQNRTSRSRNPAASYSQVCKDEWQSILAVRLFDSDFRWPKLSIAGDSKTVIEQLNGLYVDRKGQPDLLRAITLLHSLHRSGRFEPPAKQGVFAIHTPRKFNSHADALASEALQLQSNFSRWPPEGMEQFARCMAE
eukprot:12430511-Karenia_brevis.AAC.1